MAHLQGLLHCLSVMMASSLQNHFATIPLPQLHIVQEEVTKASLLDQHGKEQVSQE